MNWLLSSLLVIAPYAIGRPSLSKVATCATKDASKHVLLIKQWHLPATTITKSFKERYPHERNQTAIYDYLAELIKKKKLDLVVGEGCEGEINSEFTTTFNGWDVDSLSKIAQTKGYSKIVSHVPLKLEARFGNQIRTLCGDSKAAIEQSNLRLSNLRGWSGFWTRLNSTYPDDRLKLYSESAADVLKVPRSTPPEEILRQIKARMSDDLKGFKESLNERNQAFLNVLSHENYKVAAVVIGGLHVDDLRAKLDSVGLGCEVLEPAGYDREGEKLIGEFEKAISSNTL